MRLCGPQENACGRSESSLLPSPALFGEFPSLCCKPRALSAAGLPSLASS